MDKVESQGCSMQTTKIGDEIVDIFADTGGEKDEGDQRTEEQHFILSKLTIEQQEEFLKDTGATSSSSNFRRGLIHSESVVCSPIGVAGGVDFASTAAPSPRSEALRSSVSCSSSSSSSSSLTEQSEASVASNSCSSLQAVCFEAPVSLSSSSLPIILDSASLCSNLSAFTSSQGPIVQKRGPGRPRKDGSVPIQRKRPVFASSPFLRSTGRPRGRRRHFPGDRIHPHHRQHIQFPGLSMQMSDIPKIGEPAVALISQLPDNQEKSDAVDLAMDSDNSISSAMSFERSASDETIPELWAVKTCAFCNLGEKSLLGQGEMTRFDPTPGFNPFRKSPKARRGSSENEKEGQLEKSPKVLSFRRHKGRSRERSKSPRRSDDDSNSQPIDELSIVGYAEEPDVGILFESTGHLNAHHCCAAWSDGVCQTEDYVLISVDKAVVNGMSQKCSYCRRFGATIQCRGPKCNKVYHYPCAASSGAFQDIKTMSLLCPQHHHLAPSIDEVRKIDQLRTSQSRIFDARYAESEANCIVCDTPGNISELLFCTSCGHHYHGCCLDPIVGVNPVVRAGWQCPDCKICQTCRQPGDDNKMLVCDTCDKGYHTYCLKPVMTSIPKNGWKCKNCRICGDCGSRTPGSGISSRWHINYSVCDSCYQQRNKGLACPLCGRAYRHFAQKEMVQCSVCKKFVHEKCDESLKQQREGDSNVDYMCPPCHASGGKNGPRYVLARTPDSKDLLWPSPVGKSSSSIGRDECSISECSPLVTPHESLLALNDDSVCSVDIDLQAFERSTQQLQQLSGTSNFNFEDLSPIAGKSFCISTAQPVPNSGKIAAKKKIAMGRPRGGTKFVGLKRRVKVGDYGKRRGPKPKLKQLVGSSPVFQMETSQGKLDDEPGLENKIVLCSAKDDFVLSRDMCIMCGSFGKGEEGRLVSCSQCGQCYHPYCVSIKVTKVLLNKGWRCLDCTVCEGCGQPHDEGRLLLCDDCDISYHIYCLDPPLEKVPQGNWKCKWCVVCLHCGTTTPGHNSQWQHNYTRCGPCSSKSMCPVCQVEYKDDDLIIQCIDCDRWLHALCDQMVNEEDAEICADHGYSCLLCRPKDVPPPHLLPPPPPPPPPPLSPKIVELPKPIEQLKEPEPPPPSVTPLPLPAVPSPASSAKAVVPDPPQVKPKPQFFVDGVYLSEMGMDQIKSLTIEQPKKTRTRKPKQLPIPLKLPSLDLDDLDDKPILDSSLDQSGEGEKMEIGDDDLLKDVPVERKKRQRNLQKLGVGGFAAKARGRFSKDLEKGDSVYGQAEVQMKTEYQSFFGGLDINPSILPDKPKRKRKIKKKRTLEDSFPSYLQEAFFGKSLLDTSKDHDVKLETVASDDDVKSPTSPLMQLNDKASAFAEELVGEASTSLQPAVLQKDLPTSPKVTDDEDLGDADALKDILPLPQDLPQDDELVNMLMTESDDLTKSECLDDITDSALTNEDMCHPCDSSHIKDDSLNKDDPLTDILSSHFNLDTMVSDTGLPQMDGKEVEDLFKGVLTNDLTETVPDQNFCIGSAGIIQASPMPPSGLPAPIQRAAIPPSIPMSSPFSVPPPSPYPSEYSSSPQFSPGFSEPPPSPWLPPEPEQESPSYNQRSVMKWESDETLGPCATISAVLYANMNHPELKNDHPLWADRAKQIAKIWRGLPSEKRTQYVQKARENRAASRMQKAQQMKESGNSAAAAATTTAPKLGKRPKQGTTSPAPAPPTQNLCPVPPVPLPVSESEMLATPISPRCPPVHEKEQERIIREQKSHREQEQERQWKQLQAMRHQQAQQQQQILHEQRTQVVPSQTHPLPTLPAMVRVQQQMIGGEHLCGSGNSNSALPSSPGDPYACMPHTPMPSTSQMAADPFIQQAPLHPNLIHEAAAGQPRPSGPGHLQIVTSQSLAAGPVLSPHPPQAPSTPKVGASFTPPIQVSRVRAPIDAVQMQPFARMHVSVDPYAQMPGTPRPMSGNPGKDIFVRPQLQHRPMSPRISRPSLRLQDPYTRAPYVSQPPPLSPDQFAGQSQQGMLVKPPQVGGDIYAKQPMTPRPSQLHENMNPGSKRPSDAFGTPPSTPHPQTPTPDAYVQPRTPVSAEPFSPTMVDPRLAQSPFSPPHTPHSVESVGKSPIASSHIQQQDVHPSRSFPSPDNFQHVGALQRQDPYAQQPMTPHMPQESFPSPIGGSRPRSKLDHFPPSSPSPLPSPVSSSPLLSPHHQKQQQQQSQGNEHFVHPRTNPALLGDPYAQMPSTPRPQMMNVGPQVQGQSNRPPDSFQLGAGLEGEASLQEQLMRAKGITSPGSGVETDRAQMMARQQLRDLLQKQQMKKQIEQHLREQQGQMPLRHWPIEQKVEGMDVCQLGSPHSPDGSHEAIRTGLPPNAKSPTEAQRQIIPVMGPRPMSAEGGFRQPYPPNLRPRIGMSVGGGGPPPGQHQIVQQLHGQPQALIGQFRHPGQTMDLRMQDPQIRMAIIQQRMIQAGQLRLVSPRSPANFHPGQGNNNNPIDPYDHLVHHSQQQQQQQPGHQIGIMTLQNQPHGTMQQQQSEVPLDQLGLFGQPRLSHMPSNEPPSPTALVRPMGMGQTRIMPNMGQQQQQAHLAVMSHQQQQLLESQSPRQGVEQDQLLPSELDSDIGGESSQQGTELPDVSLEGDDANSAGTVAEELEKLEKESHMDKVGGPEDDLDDDELLGLGNDFNILEYADPELDHDIVGDGKKTNILDENLDLDDKDEDIDDDNEKGGKIGSPDKMTDVKTELVDNSQAEQSGKRNSSPSVKQQSGNSIGLGTTDFQAKFLEFSQRRDLEKAEELKNSDIFEDDSLESNIVVKTEEKDVKPLSNIGQNTGGVASIDVMSSTGAIPIENIPIVSSMGPMQPFAMQEPMPSPKVLQMGNPQRPMVMGQFGQPPVSMPADLRQQIAMGANPQRMVKPPPYPNMGVRPPPPYQAVSGVVRVPMHSRVYAGKPMMSMSGHRPPHTIGSNIPPNRPINVPEQRHLLADLLEQEKQEQRRQQQQHGILGQSQGDDSLLSDIDFEKLKADVLGTAGPPVSMSPPASNVPVQGMLPLQPPIQGSQSIRAASSPAQSLLNNSGLPMSIGHPDSSTGVGFSVRPGLSPQSNLNQLMFGSQRLVTPQDSGMHPALLQSPRPPFPITSLPPPPTPPADPVTDAERQQQQLYEHWLFQQQHVLSNQQKFFEAEVGKLRKTRKSLNTKQRNLRKNGQQLSEPDARELERITRDQTGLQKQLEQVRKQSRQHSMLFQEYHMKQQKRQQQILANTQQMSISQPNMGPSQSPMMSAPGTPISPLMSPSHMGPSPSPLGPSPSPLRQQSPSPMMQHSPLGPVPSPLMQHSPHAQPIFQQASPRMPNPNLEQQMLRSSGLQVSQEDNNPFSESFQHRELRVQQVGRHFQQTGHEPGTQDDFEDQDNSGVQQQFNYREDRFPQGQGWPRPICGKTSDQSSKPLSRAFVQGVGQRFADPNASELQQQHFAGFSGKQLSVEQQQCSGSGVSLVSQMQQRVSQSPSQYSQQSPNCSHSEIGRQTPLGIKMQSPSPSTSTGSHVEMNSSPSLMTMHSGMDSMGRGFGTHQHSLPSSPRFSASSFQDSSSGDSSRMLATEASPSSSSHSLGRQSSQTHLNIQEVGDLNVERILDIADRAVVDQTGGGRHSIEESHQGEGSPCTPLTPTGGNPYNRSPLHPGNPLTSSPNGSNLQHGRNPHNSGNAYSLGSHTNPGHVHQGDNNSHILGSPHFGGNIQDIQQHHGGLPNNPGNPTIGRNLGNVHFSGNLSHPRMPGFSNQSTLNSGGSQYIPGNANVPNINNPMYQTNVHNPRLLHNSGIVRHPLNPNNGSHSHLFNNPNIGGNPHNFGNTHPGNGGNLQYVGNPGNPGNSSSPHNNAGNTNSGDNNPGNSGGYHNIGGLNNEGNQILTNPNHGENQYNLGNPNSGGNPNIGGHQYNPGNPNIGQQQPNPGNSNNGGNTHNPGNHSNEENANNANNSGNLPDNGGNPHDSANAGSDGNLHNLGIRNTGENPHNPNNGGNSRSPGNFNFAGSFHNSGNLSNAGNTNNPGNRESLQYLVNPGSGGNPHNPGNRGNRHNTGNGGNPHNSGNGRNQHNPGNGGNPHYPGNGGNPHNPGTGGNPNNPGTGGNPHNPGNGGNPHNPGNGGNPHNPGNGGNPHNPGNGGNPHNPGSGGNPHNPGNGGNPHNSGNGGNPHNSGNGGSPHNPSIGGNSHNPGNGGNPGNAENPHNPGNGGNPHNSGNGGNPHNPGNGGNPRNPGNGGNPDNLENSHNPGNGGNPHNPGNGGNPHNPGNVGNPHNPGNVGNPHNPGNGGNPHNPGNGGNPHNPGNGGNPHNPDIGANPHNNGNGGNPRTPGNGGNPHNPGNVENPHNPGNGGNTHNLGNGGNPHNPGNVRNPHNPGNTGNPHTPGNGGNTHNSGNKEIPHNPGNGGNPHNLGNGRNPHNPGNGGTPHNPGNGGAPHNPGNGGTPHNPGNGGNPHNPGNGGNPHNPGNGGNPHNPGNGGNPHNPGNGGNPHNPGNRGNPHNPGNGGNPHNPGTGGNPHNPGNGGNPHNPGNGGNPHNLGNGGNPHNLGNGGNLHNPGNGGNPHNPGNGGNPHNPGNGGNPHNPGNGGNPHNPGNGGNTHNPGNGGNTHNPGNGENPHNPDNRGNAHNPGNGGNPHNPGNGGNPHNPDNRGNTHNPGNGGNPHNPGNGGNPHNPDNGGNTHNHDNGGNTHNPGNGGNTHNPGNGGNPHNPGNGGNPHNPGNPGNEETQHNLRNPNNGGILYNPGNGRNPPNPGSGGSLQYLGNPGSGGNPHNPSNPNNGGNPHNPGNPNNGGNPHNPGNPNNGGNPHNRGNGQNPHNPGNGGNPHNPGNGGNPHNPDNPNTGRNPHNPGNPGNGGNSNYPGNDNNEGNPGNPNNGGNYHNPGNPNNGGNHHNPGNNNIGENRNLENSNNDGNPNDGENHHNNGNNNNGANDNTGNPNNSGNQNPGNNKSGNNNSGNPNGGNHQNPGNSNSGGNPNDNGNSNNSGNRNNSGNHQNPSNVSQNNPENPNDRSNSEESSENSNIVGNINNPGNSNSSDHFAGEANANGGRNRSDPDSNNGENVNNPDNVNNPEVSNVDNHDNSANEGGSGLGNNSKNEDTATTNRNVNPTQSFYNMGMKKECDNMELTNSVVNRDVNSHFGTSSHSIRIPKNEDITENAENSNENRTPKPQSSNTDENAQNIIVIKKENIYNTAECDNDSNNCLMTTNSNSQRTHVGNMSIPDVRHNYESNTNIRISQSTDGMTDRERRYHSMAESHCENVAGVSNINQPTNLQRENPHEANVQNASNNPNYGGNLCGEDSFYPANPFHLRSAPLNANSSNQMNRFHDPRMHLAAQISQQVGSELSPRTESSSATGLRQREMNLPSSEGHSLVNVRRLSVDNLSDYQQSIISSSQTTSQIRSNSTEDLSSNTINTGGLERPRNVNAPFEQDSSERRIQHMGVGYGGIQNNPMGNQRIMVPSGNMSSVYDVRHVQPHGPPFVSGGHAFTANVSQENVVHTSCNNPVMPFSSGQQTSTTSSVQFTNISGNPQSFCDQPNQATQQDAFANQSIITTISSMDDPSHFQPSSPIVSQQFQTSQLQDQRFLPLFNPACSRPTGVRMLTRPPSTYTVPSSTGVNVVGTTRLVHVHAGSARPVNILQSRMPIAFVQRGAYAGGIHSSSTIGQPRICTTSVGTVGNQMNVPNQMHHQSHVREMMIHGNPRVSHQEQIGQPQLQMPQYLMSPSNRAAHSYGGNPPAEIQQGQGATVRYGMISGTVPRVSQVGLPNPSAKPVTSSGHLQSLPVSSPSCVSMSPSLACETPTSLADSTGNTVANFSFRDKVDGNTFKQEQTVSVKLESSPSPGCLMAVKQESRTDIYEGQRVTERSVAVVTKTGDMPFSSCAVSREQIISKSSSGSFQLTSSQSSFEQEGKKIFVSADEGVPQNALLKQLLQNSQPQQSQQVSRTPSIESGTESSVPSSVGQVERNVSQDDNERTQQVLPPQMLQNVSVTGTQNVTKDDADERRLVLDLQQRGQFMEELSKGGKRKQGSQQKRQPKQTKVKDGIPAKKRLRKGSNAKPEEDYDSFVEATLVLLHSLPRLHILEPEIKPNYNVCPVFGSGDLSPGECKLKGTYGRTILLNHPDYYSIQPFGSKPPVSVLPIPPTSTNQRGFYNQEFPSRCVSVGDHSSQNSSDSICASNILTSHQLNVDRPKRELETPDTIISSSSPECTLFEPLTKYAGLRLIDDENSRENDLKSISPIIPLFAPIPLRIRPLALEEKTKDSIFQFDDDDPCIKDKENLGGELRLDKEALLLKSKLGLGPSTPLKDSGNVAITLTLTSAAAEDIRGVLSVVADLLKIPIPISFDITERTTTPPSQRLGLYKKGGDTSIQSILKGPPRFCRHCDVVVLNSGIKKKFSELPFVPKEDQEEDEVIFCSTNCYMQYALTNRSGGDTSEKEAATVVTHLCDIFGPIGGKLESSEKSSVISTDDNENKVTHSSSSEDSKQSNSESPKKINTASEGDGVVNEKGISGVPQEKIRSESHATIKCAENIKSEQGLPNVKDVCVTVASTSASQVSKIHRKHRSSESVSEAPLVKKWKGVKWKYFNLMLKSAVKYKTPTEDDINHMLDHLGICIKPKKLVLDARICVLCHDVGDGDTNGASRLLNMDVDKWIHLNCALWSAEVYETVNGALMNVDVALKRGLTLECVTCHRKGATLGCFRIRCTNIYHFSCAMKDKCMFFKDKTMLCPMHIPKQVTPEMKENELPSLTVFRRVYINRDENRQVASVMHRADQSFLLRVGNLIFLNIGQLLPHQLQAFHTSNFIYPVGFKIIRMYWSTRQFGKRCHYLCSIHDRGGKPEFRIQVKEIGFPDHFYKDVSPKAVWQQVLEPIGRLRREAKAIKVFSAFITGEDLYGLNEPSILRVIESLPGIESLTDYNFKYGRSPLLELPLAINPTGSARTECKLRTHFKRPHTLHTSSSSRLSFQAAITGLEATCPYTKQFVHSKSSQYRKMKVEWRNNVYLARSRIQGLGLYAAREIEKHTMVIEYIGQLIRNEVAESRERLYEAQNRGIYMFRLDDGRVIDASVSGGLARYINHSCDPNCVAEVVQIDRDNRIIIFASRRINRGEELSYDYKFDIEDDQHKIPCLCGAGNCKKWMN